MEVDKKAFKSFMRNSRKVSMNSISRIIDSFLNGILFYQSNQRECEQQNKSENLSESSVELTGHSLQLMLIISFESLWLATACVCLHTNIFVIICMFAKKI